MWSLIKLGLLVILVLVITGFLAYFWLKGKITKFLTKVVTVAQPARIHLVRDRDVEWDDRQAVAKQVQALRAAGMRTITVYRIEELEDFKLVALAHPEEGYGAAVYEHAESGVWCDLVAMFADGTRLRRRSMPRSTPMSVMMPVTWEVRITTPL